MQSYLRSWPSARIRIICRFCHHRAIVFVDFAIIAHSYFADLAIIMQPYLLIWPSECRRICDLDHLCASIFPSRYSSAYGMMRKRIRASSLPPSTCGENKLDLCDIALLELRSIRHQKTSLTGRRRAILSRGNYRSAMLISRKLRNFLITAVHPINYPVMNLAE